MTTQSPATNPRSRAPGVVGPAVLAIPAPAPAPDLLAPPASPDAAPVGAAAPAPAPTQPFFIGVPAPRAVAPWTVHTAGPPVPAPAAAPAPAPVRIHPATPKPLSGFPAFGIPAQFGGAPVSGAFGLAPSSAPAPVTFAGPATLGSPGGAARPVQPRPAGTRTGGMPKQPLPPPGTPGGAGAGSAGGTGGTGTMFGGWAALLFAFSTFVLTFTYRFRCAPVQFRPVTFVSLLERPG